MSEGVKQHYSLKVSPGKENLPWVTQIVMSTLPVAELPSSLNKPGANRLCKVESRLPQEMRLKNRHWYSGGHQYRKAEFDVQVLIGPADLKFQTLGNDGVLSQSHDNIEVEWFSPSDTKTMRRPTVFELGTDELDTERSSRGVKNSKTMSLLRRRFAGKF